ncbi:histidine triad protein HinT [Mycoplasmopsis synoviae]|uniref:histidine triad protein HinT n=1 Tax=Mycoplasmopsis synoviae TaxID=2109 RepID=UPI0035689656
MEKSVFKKIIDRELPAEIIYEDDLVIAIMDAFPVSEGHFLVIPKSEKPNMLTHSEEEMTYAFKVAYKLAKERLWDKGIKDFRLMINTGLKGEQTVFHTHIHIVPYK